MLRGLFKNTETTQYVIVDTDDSEAPPLSQPKNVEAGEKGFFDDLLGNEREGPDMEVNDTEFVDEDHGGWRLDMLKELKEQELKYLENEFAKQVHEEDLNSTLPEKIDDGDSSSDGYDSAEERMAISSCDEEDVQYPEFNEAIDMKDPQYSLCMLFSSGAVFRKAVRQHAIVHQRPIRLRKKIKWICVEGCEWKCYGIQQQRSTSFQIKILNRQHTCNPTWVQKQVNSTWIANAYEDEISLNPAWPVKSFHARVVNDLKCNINQSMIYRAMQKARDNIIGKHET